MNMRKGSKHTPEAILKNSLAKLGKPSPNKGKKFDQEWRDNLRKSHLGHKINDNQRLALMLGRQKHIIMVYDEKKVADSGYRHRLNALNRYRRRQAARLFGRPHTDEEWETLKAKCKHTCLACLRLEPEIKLTRDHIVSLSKGGSDCIENIQPLCQSCNSKKHTKSIRY